MPHGVVESQLCHDKTSNSFPTAKAAGTREDHDPLLPASRHKKARLIKGRQHRWPLLIFAPIIPFDRLHGASRGFC